ncbi:DUF1189 domain-containing protein [Cytobacillus solani]|uniref:DUF1189 domain-containing protein n=1 Tax=Cytobacillus solani TaxID=1637975 RepID=A0A0Q3VIY4_9BACI|nr:DUF1189 domain-containing protein [Cytobacillus solani]KOP83461.1 hypothetical protein AMS60_13790 [Bacillus sp. FJAT-21945]KQL20535.1 hypothetical protein AN957_19405 [Cytobacillus solani]
MNIFNQFIKSLYSPKDIAQYRFQGIGKTILYVFFLTFLSLIPSIIYFSTALINGMEAIQSSVKTELPSFVIENGEMQADLEAPKIINKDEFTIILDPTGTVDQEELSNSNNTIALLKNEAFIKAGGQTQSFPYSMVPDFTLTNDDLENILASIDSSLAIIIPLIAVVIYIVAAGLKFIEISFLALVGLLLQKLMDVNMQYRHTWRIAAYSVTLPAVFFTVMDSLRTLVPNGAIINWFVAFIILLLVIKEIPKLEKK